MKRLPATFGCPVELSLELLGGKWKPVILARLKQGPMRYSDLRRQIPALSDKMLTQRLSDLKAAGLVEQSGDAGAGPYRLSARGETLKPVLQALYDWGRDQAAVLPVRVDPASLPSL